MILIAVYGLYQSRNNLSQNDFFLAGKKTHWITAMFSIVATETSVLTFISVPGIAYRGDWTFLQLSIGYLFGRIIVSFALIPTFIKYGVTSIYEILGEKFDKKIQKLASLTFLITRVLADGVRFLATAIIIQTITGWSISESLLLIGFITLVYTVSGGLKTIIRIDAFQFAIYLFSGLICLYFLSKNINLFEAITYLSENNKFKTFDLTGSILNKPFMFISAFIGGVMLSFASHGADYMMVQRVLATRNVKSAQKAMIGSGFFVIFQFLLFLFLGSIIYFVSDCLLLEKDREISYVINHILPPGFKGIVIAGILSAAMSTLSSSINSLASSTIKDWLPEYNSIKSARFIALFWTFFLIIGAFLFNESSNALVVIGLKIASFTYGVLLSFFILSKLNLRIKTSFIILGYISGILIVFYLMKYEIAWTYYIISSVIINLLVTLSLYYLNPKKIVEYFMFFILFITLIPLFIKDKNLEKISTKILDINIHNSCIEDSIWFGYDVFKSNPKEFENILNIGIVVNHTSDLISIQKDKKIIEVHLGNNPIYVKKIFTPEHGIDNSFQAGEKILGDMSYNIPIISLYGKDIKPKKEDIENLDAIFFDIQDIGSRYYTYVSTLTKVMEACSENNIPLLILDRPNPIGNKVSGPTLKKEFSSFVGMHLTPINHGMTIGELAYMINESNWLNTDKKADLTIVKMQGWDRTMYYEHTGKKWIAPSPNIPDNITAFIYTGTCLMEGTNLSEGRGTDNPFLNIGAPWLDSKVLITELSKLKLLGVKFQEVKFIPRFIPSKSQYPKYKDQVCNGVKINIVDREVASPLLIAVHIINIISQNHPEDFKFISNNFIDKLYGSDKLKNLINKGDDINQLFNDWSKDEENFKNYREKYLLY